MKTKTIVSKVFIVVLTIILLTTVLVACGNTTAFKLLFEVDGVTVHTIDTAGKETIALPTAPTKEGFVFDGWYFDKDVWAKPLTANSLINTKLGVDTKVYAKWLVVKAETYTVTFESNGGSVVAAITDIVKDTAIAKPADPTLIGHTFGGWYKEAALTNAYDFATARVNADIRLYAKWVATLTGISVTTPATKTTFDVGAAFVSTGLIISATYGDGSAKLLQSADYTIDSTAFNNAVSGTYGIIIKLKADETKTVSYNVTVRSIASYRIKAGSVYEEKVLDFDTWSYDGIVIEAVYDNGDVADVAYTAAPTLEGEVLVCEFRSLIDSSILLYTLNITIVNSSTLAIASLVITKAPIVTTFEKGGTFNMEGLELSMIYEGFPNILVEATVGRDYDLSSDTAIDMAIAGEKIVKFYSITTPAVTVSYPITVVDTTGATVTKLEIGASSAHQQNFYKGEDLNFDGLVINKIMSNGAAIGLTDVDYSISTNYKKDIIGAYTVTLSLNTDAAQTISYDIAVVACDFEGLYYKEEIEPSMGAYATVVYAILRDGEIRRFDGSAYDPSAPYKIIRMVDDTIVLTWTNAVGGAQQLEYDPATGKMTDSTMPQPLQKVGMGQIVNSVVYAGMEGLLLITNAQGYLEQRSIDGLAFLGALFLDAGRKTAVTATTHFAVATDIYLLPPDVDYTGKPFIGDYTRPGGNRVELVIGAKKIKTLQSGQEVDYMATEGNGVWTIVFMGMPCVYNLTTKQLVAADGTVFQQAEYSASKVCVTLAGAVDPSYLGRYVFDVGATVAAIQKASYGNYYVYTFADYSGTPITADTTITVASVAAVSVGQLMYRTFGTYAKSVTFDLENDSFTIDLRGVTVASGAFTFVGVNATTYSFSLVIDGATIPFTVIGAGQGNATLEIATGAYAGAYSNNSANFFDRSEPFIDRFVNKNSADPTNPDSMEIYVHNNFSSNVIPIIKAINIVANDTNDGYIITLIDYQDGVTVLAYTTATHSISYNGATYTGSPYKNEPFVGMFSSINGYDTIIIDEMGTHSNLPQDYTLTTVDKTQAGIITLTYTSTNSANEPETYVYYIADDAFKVTSPSGQFIYEREISDLFGNEFFVNKEMTSGTDTLRIEASGYFRTRDIKGKVTAINGDKLTLKLYGATDSDITMAEATVTQNAAGDVTFVYQTFTYTYVAPKWIKAPFIGKYYANEESGIAISFSDSGSVSVYGIPALQNAKLELKNVWDGANIVVINFNETPETEMTFIYDSVADTVTMDGTILRRS